MTSLEKYTLNFFSILLEVLNDAYLENISFKVLPFAKLAKPQIFVKPYWFCSNLEFK
jgi:hypothetical protein